MGKQIIFDVYSPAQTVSVRIKAGHVATNKSPANIYSDNLSQNILEISVLFPPWLLNFYGAVVGFTRVQKVFSGRSKLSVRKSFHITFVCSLLADCLH